MKQLTMFNAKEPIGLAKDHRRNDIPLNEPRKGTPGGILSKDKVIRVDFYPHLLHGDFVVSSRHHKITAGQVKDKAMELISIEKCKQVVLCIIQWNST